MIAAGARGEGSGAKLYRYEIAGCFAHEAAEN
jgi:hypothetical protein